ncbi:MAG: ion transporter [Gemmatimonadetes bacterium]|nr:ion transporter [Gemmatimonadota bacterium]
MAIDEIPRGYPGPGWRRTLHEVIFEAETPAGKGFDLGLLLAIVLSVAAVVLESVAGIRARHGAALRAVEWFFTILFTVEYVLRLMSVQRPLRYALSFFGIVDFVAIVPTYLSVLLPGAQSLIVVRALRLLRVFRVMKLVHFVGEARMLRAALRASSRKIVVFLGTVLTLVLIIGALMYLIEGETSGFTNIPVSIYWAIVTMTTVGYGDIAPATVPGRMLASIVMIIGYGIIAVPTGIVTVEMANVRRRPITTQACPVCGRDGHDRDAKHCKYCGSML